MLRTLKYIETSNIYEYEYAISIKTPEADTSDSNEEGLMALSIQ